MSQPSSPILKARKQSAAAFKLHLLWGLLLIFSGVCIVWYSTLTLSHSAVVHVPNPLEFRPAEEEQSSPSSLDTVTLAALDQVAPPQLQTLTAILPVSLTSISNLRATLNLILDDPGCLSEILVVTPQSALVNARGILWSVTSSINRHIELSLLPWPVGATEDTAPMRLARQVSTDWVLFLADNGLDSVEGGVRDMLLQPRPTILPMGPRGYTVSNQTRACVRPGSLPQSASYLVPPFVVRASLLSNFRADSSAHYLDGIWASLGRYIYRSRSDGIGGIVVRHKEPPLPWCAEESNSQNQTQKTHGSPGTEDQGLIVHTRPINVGIFVVLLPSLRDLHSFSSAICRLLNDGHTVDILLYAESLRAEKLEDRRARFDECELKYHTVFTDIGDVVVNWLKNLVAFADIIITSTEPDVATVALNTFVLNQSHSPCVVRVPLSDLPFCDWMGSLSLQEWQHWHTPHIDITVVTNNRPHSLSRLLLSLASARYFGDSSSLRINMEQTSDDETVRAVNAFRWEHGSVFIHHRVIHGGLLPAVVESWFPHSNDSYGLILEDDVELSPLFYAWLKMTLLHYRYGHPDDRSPRLFGISLYQQKNLELRPEGRHRFNARDTFAAAGLPFAHTPYLSQIPCSWGALYFPEHWREFHAYLAARLSEVVPGLGVDAQVVPRVRSNRWTRSWKKYFIELVYLRGYVMLYPNFADYVSLSTNHLEVGSHVKDVPASEYLRKKKLFLLPLMPLPPVDDGDTAQGPATALLDLPKSTVPPWIMLPMLDLLGLLAVETTLMERGSARRTELFGCSDTLVPTSDVRTLLCLDLGVPDEPP